ncbi:MAG: hypothetical protein PHX38_01200 [Sulfuricella sp.]|nr:hypothetical protein [Sulfuricella sp.]
MPNSILLRKALIEIIRRHGSAVYYCPEQFKTALLAHEIGHPVLLDLLGESVRLEVPPELLRLSNKSQPFFVAQRLRDYFQRRISGLSVSQAEWIVATWAMALGLSPYEEAPYPTQG